MLLMTLTNGRLRFSTHGKSNSAFNYAYAYPVNAVGGIKRLVKTNLARNMWAVMKEFKLLPNDPQLKALDFQALDFILYSMQQDVEEAKQKNPTDTNNQFEDTEFDKVYNDPHATTMLADDDNLDDIYSQVQDMTEDASYDERLDSKIKNAIIEKKQKDENTDEIVKRNQAKLEKDLKDKGIDLDNFY